MNRFFSNPLNWLLLVIATILIAFMALVIRVDYSTDIPGEKEAPAKEPYDLLADLQGSDITNLRETFPYHAYLDKANLHDIRSVLRDLQALDSFNRGDEMTNQEVLSIALTRKLEERIKPAVTDYNPDSLIQLVQWAEKFHAWSLLDEPHSILFESVYLHWFNFVSATLADYYESDYEIKYNYKFRYLCDRIKEKQFVTPIKGTYTEKVINKLIQKNGSYLFNKFWHATTFLYKCMVFLLVLVVLFPYFYIFKTIRSRKQI